MMKIDYMNLTKEDFIKEQKHRNEIFSNISNSIGTRNFDDDYVQSQIKELYKWMNRFYDCSISTFRGLSEVYESDYDFSQILTKNYNEQMPKFLSNAILHFCDKNNVN